MLRIVILTVMMASVVTVGNGSSVAAACADYPHKFILNQREVPVTEYVSYYGGVQRAIDWVTTNLEEVKRSKYQIESYIERQQQNLVYLRCLLAEEQRQGGSSASATGPSDKTSSASSAAPRGTTKAATLFRDAYDHLLKRDYGKARMLFEEGLRLDDRDVNAWLYYRVTLLKSQNRRLRKVGDPAADTDPAVVGKLSEIEARVRQLKPTDEQWSTMLTGFYGIYRRPLNEGPERFSFAALTGEDSPRPVCMDESPSSVHEFVSSKGIHVRTLKQFEVYSGPTDWRCRLAILLIPDSS